MEEYGVVTESWGDTGDGGNYFRTITEYKTYDEARKNAYPGDFIVKLIEEIK